MAHPDNLVVARTDAEIPPRKGRIDKNGLVPVRVEVPPEMFQWATDRSGIDRDVLEHRFPRLDEWVTGEVTPTLKQLERFALSTHTPVGFFFLREPPEESVPIPDFRTLGDERIARPSPSLLDTIYQCQQRQEWFREYAIVNRLAPVSFVGGLTLQTPVQAAAAALHEVHAFDLEERGTTWTDAFRLLADEAEKAGVLVMVNGVVGSNTHRKLDPAEFRGFALVDDLAPIVFVNGADTRAAQIFTLAHELTHIWLGESGLDDVDLGSAPSEAIERWCNSVAAEFLVPLEYVAGDYSPTGDLTDELDRLARRFKVSTLVVLRRLHDAGIFDWEQWHSLHRAELARLLDLMAETGTGTGGNFYNTQPVRVSKRFARSVIVSALEGQTLFSDAFRMLGFRKRSTFDELARRLGVE